MEKTRNTAKARLKKAFLDELRQSRPASAPRLSAQRFGKALDAHFCTYCSFYDPKLSSSLARKSAAFFDSGFSASEEICRPSITAVTNRAGVNRATFSKPYDSLDALFAECRGELTNTFFAVEIPDEMTPQTMYAYAEALSALLKKHYSTLFALSLYKGTRTLSYEIGAALRARLEASMTAETRASFVAKENAALLPALFAARFALVPIETLFPKLYPDRNLPAYDFSRSLLENTAALLALRHGGEKATYLAYLLAFCQLTSEKRTVNIGVSALCALAGYGRSTFYLHFSDLADFRFKVLESAALVSVSALSRFLEFPEAITPQTLRIFRGELEEFSFAASRGVGDLFAVVCVYLTRLLLARYGADEAAPDAQRQAAVFYETVYAMRVFSLYCLGNLTDAELSAKSRMLARIKTQLEQL